MHVIIDEVLDIGGTLQKPKQFMHNGAHIELLGGNGRKALTKIKTQLAAENAFGPRAGAVGLGGAVVPDVAQ